MMEMTENKRFMVDDAGTLIDMETRNMYELAYEVVDLLNEQHETIQQLKAEIKQLNHDLDLYEENNTNEVLNKLRIELTSRMNDCIEEFKE